jgi:cytochrome oxidase assembly protein ShyY1
VARYRWALRPGWILSHLFVLACVVAFVCLGMWQFNRLMGRREANDIIRSRQAMAVVPVDEVMGAGSSPDEVADAVFRQVTISGTYAVDDQVLIRNRSNHGSPGYWVVTPLTTRDGEAVAINRGWIPIQTGDAASPDFYAPPAGTVSVTGLVVDSQEQSGLGVTDPEGERLATLSRVDVPRLQQQAADDLYPMFVNLVSQEPAQASQLPEPVPPPELTDGSHLNYTGQWFIFAALTVIVYPLLLRRTARNKDAEAAEAAASGDGDGGPGHGDGGLRPTGPGPAGDGPELASSAPSR